MAEDTGENFTAISYPMDENCLKICAIWRPLSTAVYYCLAPLYLTTALFSRALLQFGLYKALKREKSYLFQLIFVGCGFMDVCSMGLYVVFLNWLSAVGWFKQCYWCVWISCKFGSFFYDFGVTNSLIMSVIMATDRLLSLALPVKYAKLVSSRKRIAVAACGICFSVGLNGFDWFFLSPAPSQGAWAMSTNVGFILSATGAGWMLAQNLFLFCCLPTLIVLNCFMLKLFRKRVESFSQFTSDQDRLTLKKQDEHIAVLLTAWQCFFVSLNSISVIVYYCFLNYFRTDCICDTVMVTVVTDAVCMLVQLSDVYICLAVNKRFRELFLDGFSVCFRAKKSSPALANSKPSRKTAEKSTSKSTTSHHHY